MQWRFLLDTVEIDEPIGFDNFTMIVKRDPLWHGIFFEASNTTLGFYGEAYTIIKAAKDSDGVDAEIVFTAQQRCEGEEEYTTMVQGKLNFASYSETCGSECIIRMNIEQENCAMLFKNRFDQKVEIESLVAFDGASLDPYAGLNFPMKLATQQIPVSSDADVDGYDTLSLDPMDFYLGNQNLLVRPTYGVVNDDSILTGQFDNPANNFQDTEENFLISPQVLLEENSTCVNQEFQYNIRLKGAVDINITHSEGFGALFSFRTVVDYWDGDGTHVGPGNLTGNATSLHNDFVANLFDAPIPFDVTYTGTVNLPVGSGLYAYIKIYYSAGFDTNATAGFNIVFDRETSFLLSSVKECPPTDANVFMINETLSRATEVITNGCLKVQSDYYGRTDSQPYAADSDGCGSLRVLTNGLKIRQANDKAFFASMKQLMDGLRPIDNIGMGMESDRVRIEPAEYFYQDVEILVCDAVPESRTDIEEQLIYSTIICGYEKWEIKSIKGIDEFNSGKEYRTEVKAVSNNLNIRSQLIASGYIIENLRTTTLVNSGNTDNTYDNDIFIICVERGGAYDQYIVEQGNIENAANIFSPATAYNWRIRPLYNLMRWFKSIGKNIVRFTSGVGNYEATGNLPATDLCRLENKPLAENDDIEIADFEDTSDATPIYQPEIIEFEYPLSIADYNRIKQNPYGYITSSCGTGYIRTVEYKPAEGKAKFELIKK